VAIHPTSGAAAPETTMAVVHTVYGPRLDQPKINRLAQAVADGITPSGVDFETNWHGTQLRAPSLQQLRREADRCLQPGDLRRLDTLVLSSAGHGRQVRVAIGEQAATVTVEAEAAWAIGRAEQIRDILLNAYGCSRLQRWREAHLSLGGTIASLVVVVVAFLLGLLAVDLRSIVLAAAFMTATAATGYLVGRWRSARNRSVIWVAGALPRHGWAGWCTTDRIAAVTMLVGLLGVIATLLT